MTEQTEQIDTLFDIRLLEPDKTRFYQTKGGFVGLVYNDNDYERIHLRKALPNDYPECYIFVLDKDKKDIGMIEDIHKFPDDQIEILKQELALTYYTPQIQKIHTAKLKMDFLYLEADTNGGKREIAVKDASRNMHKLDEKRILVFDCEGNRYTIDDFYALDAASQKQIEPYLF